LFETNKGGVKLHRVIKSIAAAFLGEITTSDKHCVMCNWFDQLTRQGCCKETKLC